MRRWYILNEDNKPIMAASVIEAAKWLEKNPEKKAVKQEHVGDIYVSTVFLALDHSLPWDADKTPVLWETIIFGGEHDQYQERYTSYEDALEGHKKALELVNKQDYENRE
jgi:hypothetical protein